MRGGISPFIASILKNNKNKHLRATCFSHSFIAGQAACTIILLTVVALIVGNCFSTPIIYSMIATIFSVSSYMLV